MREPLHDGNEEALISSSLHYRKCMIRQVANFAIYEYIIQHDKVNGLTRLPTIYVTNTSRLIHTWRRL